MNNLLYTLKETKWYIVWYIITLSWTLFTEIDPITKLILWLIPLILIYMIGSVMVEQRKMYKKYLNDKE